MSLAPGTRLGPYEILALVGSGGMGEVYRARDPRLERSIALKILPEQLAHDAERRARLEHEARSIAALNHPNIVTLHSVEQADGALFLTMEYVEGKPLNESIPRGGLPLDRLLAIAIPLADAISAAHAKGILHRDLKPANVMVTEESRVKVLDFGLAKLAEAARGDEDVTALQNTQLTSEGRIVGTVAYMSPEQADGKRLDARSDVFSLGVMLHEMATGEHPFKGGSALSTITRVIRDTPPAITEIRPSLPRDLAVIVRRCLVKDPEFRTQTAKDLRNQLDDLKNEAHSRSDSGIAAVSSKPPRKFQPLWMTLAFAGVLAGVAGTYAITNGSRRGTNAPPAITEVSRLTHDASFSEWPSWSPDGTVVAFASNRSGNFDVYVRRVEGGQEVNVTQDPAQDYQPAISPDGNSIAFVSTRSSRTGLIKVGSMFVGAESYMTGGDIWIAPTFGGRARRLAANGNAPVWHPGGQRVSYVTGPELHRAIMEIEVQTGAPHPVLASETSQWEINRLRYSPSGAWISFETTNADLYIMPATGGEPRKLTSGYSHAWNDDGTRLYYLIRGSAGSHLACVAIDAKAGTLRGEPQILGVMTGTLKDLAASPDGTRLVLSEVEASFNLTRLPLTPTGAPAGPEEPLTTGHVYDRQPDVSPDSRRVVYLSDRLGMRQAWIMDLETGGLDQLQLPGSNVDLQGPRWMPDGRKILIKRVGSDHKVSLWRVAADGSDALDLGLIPTPDGNVDSVAVTPNGKEAIFPGNVQGHYELVALDLDTRQTRQITNSPDDKTSAVFSPKGDWLSYSSNANGTSQIWRMPSTGGNAEPLTKGIDRDRHQFYSPDGRWMYFQPNHLNIFRMPAEGGPVQQVTHFPEAGLFIESPTITPNGKFLIYCRLNGSSSLWVLHLAEGSRKTR